MKELKDYFVTQEQAESLKELGFKDECLAWYRENGDFNTNSAYKNISTSAPLIAQAMDWLLDELGVLTKSFTVDEGIERFLASTALEAGVMSEGGGGGARLGFGIFAASTDKGAVSVDQSYGGCGRRVANGFPLRIMG